MKKEVYVIGLPDGETSRAMCSQCEMLDLLCHLILPESLPEKIAWLSSRVPYVFLSVETTYSSEQLAYISTAVLRFGESLIPVGNDKDWENVVPLEMPELYTKKVYPLESEWYNVSVPEIAHAAPEQAAYQMLNGTLVHSESPNFSEPLVDLRQEQLSSPLQATVADTPRRKAKFTKRPDISLYLLLALLAVVVLTPAIALYLLLFAPDAAHSTEQEKIHVAQEPNPDCGEQEEDKVSVNQEEKENPASSGDETKDKDDAVLQEDSPLSLHQKNECSSIEWQKARPGNDVYKQLESGQSLGCTQCIERLQQPIVQHICPTAGTSDYLHATENGMILGCEACKKNYKTLAINQYQHVGATEAKSDAGNVEEAQKAKPRKKKTATKPKIKKKKPQPSQPRPQITPAPAPTPKKSGKSLRDIEVPGDFGI